jgi:hypothetical protein
MFKIHGFTFDATATVVLDYFKLNTTSGFIAFKNPFRVACPLDLGLPMYL